MVRDLGETLMASRDRKGAEEADSAPLRSRLAKIQRHTQAILTRPAARAEPGARPERRPPC
jgi:hypothetical protein